MRKLPQVMPNTPIKIDVKPKKNKPAGPKRKRPEMNDHVPPTISRNEMISVPTWECEENEFTKSSLTCADMRPQQHMYAFASKTRALNVTDDGIMMKKWEICTIVKKKNICQHRIVESTSV